jgi:hypothetical protein
LLAVKVQVEVLQGTDAAHRNSESRWQPRGHPTIDQEPDPIVKTSRRVLIEIVFSRSLADCDLADLAASAAPMNVVGDDPRPR